MASLKNSIQKEGRYSEFGYDYVRDEVRKVIAILKVRVSFPLLGGDLREWASVDEQRYESIAENVLLEEHRSVWVFCGGLCAGEN